MVARLDPAATPRKLATLDFGAGALAGIFYGLAEGFDSSAFDMARHQDGQSSRVIKSIEAATRRWTKGVSETRRTIREIRQSMLSDDDLNGVLQKYPINWAVDFEASQIQTRWACIHGDLHGSNVLISTNGLSAVLIDYGDVRDGPASLDPVTLELSLLFHPQGLGTGEWPSLERARQWGSIGDYLEGCPAAEFIYECREWAGRVAAGNREIAASAYSYLIPTEIR